MATTTTYTDEARQVVGNFVVRAGKTFLLVRAANAFGEVESVKITPAILANFFATQACNLTSGCRTLGSLTGDWRGISALAQAALDWLRP